MSENCKYQYNVASKDGSTVDAMITFNGEGANQKATVMKERLGSQGFPGSVNGNDEIDIAILSVSKTLNNGADKVAQSTLLGLEIEKIAKDLDLTKEREIGGR